jgi:hypothetical protein
LAALPRSQPHRRGCAGRRLSLAVGRLYTFQPPSGAANADRVRHYGTMRQGETGAPRARNRSQQPKRSDEKSAPSSIPLVDRTYLSVAYVFSCKIQQEETEETESGGIKVGALWAHGNGYREFRRKEETPPACAAAGLKETESANENLTGQANRRWKAACRRRPCSSASNLAFTEDLGPSPHLTWGYSPKPALDSPDPGRASDRSNVGFGAGAGKGPAEGKTASELGLDRALFGVPPSGGA